MGNGQVLGGTMQPAIAAASSAKPNQNSPALGHPVDAARRKQQIPPDDSRNQRGNRGKAEELHGEVGEDRAGIAHGVGDGVVRGVRKAWIGNVPGGEAGDPEGDSQEQAGADQPADLPPRESLDAVARIGHRERC